METTQSSHYRVLIADNESEHLAELRSLIAQTLGWEVVTQAANTGSLPHATQTLSPDILIIDVASAPFEDLEVLQQIKGDATAPCIVALIPTDSPQIESALLSAGVDVCISKGSSAHGILITIEHMLRTTHEAVHALTQLSQLPVAEEEIPLVTATEAARVAAIPSAISSPGRNTRSRTTVVLAVTILCAIGLAWRFLAHERGSILHSSQSMSSEAPHNTVISDHDHWISSNFPERPKDLVFDTRGESYRTVQRVLSEQPVDYPLALALPTDASLSYTEKLQRAVQDYIRSNPAELRDISHENLVLKEIRFHDMSKPTEPPLSWALAYAHITQQIEGLDVDRGKVLLSLKITPTTRDNPQIVLVSKELFPELRTLPEPLGPRGFGIDHLRRRLNMQVNPQHLHNAIRYYKGRWRTVEEYFIPESGVYGSVSPDGETFIQEAVSHAGPQDLTLYAKGGHVTAPQIVTLPSYRYRMECCGPYGESCKTFNGLTTSNGKVFSQDALGWLGQRHRYGLCELSFEAHNQPQSLLGPVIFLDPDDSKPKRVLPSVIGSFVHTISDGDAWTQAQNEIVSQAHHNRDHRDVGAVNILKAIEKAQKSAIFQRLGLRPHSADSLLAFIIGDTWPQQPLPWSDTPLGCNALSRYLPATSSEDALRVLAFVASESCFTATESITYHEYFHSLHSPFAPLDLYPSREAVADIFSAYMTNDSLISWIRYGVKTKVRNIRGIYLLPQNIDPDEVASKPLASKYGINGHPLSLPLSSSYWEIKDIVGKEMAADLFLGVAIHSGAERMSEYFQRIMTGAKIYQEQGAINCDQYKGIFRAFLKRGFVTQQTDVSNLRNICNFDYFDDYEFINEPKANISHLSQAFWRSQFNYFTLPVSEACEERASPGCFSNVVYIDYERDAEGIPIPPRAVDMTRSPAALKTGGSGRTSLGWTARRK